MAHKLLVITAGTVAAGVGLEFEKQIRTHSASELHVMVRYIDTAYLPTRYSELRSGEWFQMTISPQFMDNVRRNQEKHPHLKDLLYPGLLPQIAGSGGGSIRYNAAGAILINEPKMKEWLTASITNLVNSGDGEVNLSIALVISSVGATGSGTLERLVDMIVDCSLHASIPPPLHCDVFILQPGMQGVSDLGLANTLSLYAEMAASRLAKYDFNNTDIRTKAYRGRTILVGWGSQRYMASMDQLKEAAATLVRLTHDSATSIAAEFQEREVDNHVLRELDRQTFLPSHLSSATVVTISLGDLEEKIIQRDAVLLIDTLFFGGKPSKTAAGDYFIPSTMRREDQTDGLLTALNSFLQGETPEDRYRHLVERLKEGISNSISSLQTNAVKLKDRTVQEQASKLRNDWKNDKEEISRNGRKKIQEQGASLVREALSEIVELRRNGMATKLSLQDIREEYRQMHTIITSTLSTPQESQGGIDESEVTRKIKSLEGAIFGKERALQQAIGAVQTNLEDMLRRESHTAAVEVLKVLQTHCDESLRDLDIVLQRLLRQRKNNPKWAAADQPFHIESSHLLHMPALSTNEEITRYADLVSIFASKTRKRDSGGTIGRILSGEEEKVDQVAAFRKWLGNEKQLDALFEGEIEILLDLAQNYARKQVHTEVLEHSVVDVLLQAGIPVLQQRLQEASSKAHSLVQFDKQFAEEMREKRHVSAYWRTNEQRSILENAITKAFGQECTLIGSKDPGEIAIFYYVDGLPMSAVTDLTGRCLDAFLNRRRSWYLQTKQNGNVSETNTTYNQRVGVPVYSGRDAQKRVLETGVIRQLYAVRGQNVGVYKPTEIPELSDGKDPQ